MLPNLNFSGLGNSQNQPNTNQLNQPSLMPGQPNIAQPNQQNNLNFQPNNLNFQPNNSQQNNNLNFQQNNNLNSQQNNNLNSGQGNQYNFSKDSKDVSNDKEI